MKLLLTHPQPSPFRISRLALRVSRRAFSLVEVLLAIFILGIGMIMVASVFPVGANWTRQTTESSIGQTVAQNALSVLRAHYGPNGDLRDYLAPDYISVVGSVISPNGSNKNSILKASATGTNGALTVNVKPFTLQAPPGFFLVPATERAYQFGSASPFPATNVPVCTYFWTALMRLNTAHAGGNADTNGIAPSSSYKYDVYILVFRKGAAEHVFTSAGPLPASGYLDILGTRDFDNNFALNFPETLLPAVGYALHSSGTYNASHSPSVYDAVPAMGQYGIGAYSGTVFHQVLDPASSFQSAVPSPFLLGQPASLVPQEPIIYCPAADGTANSASPLIYIYQTTMSF